MCLFICMPSLGVYYCQQLTLSDCLSGTQTLSVCPDVCHTPSNCFFFFVSRWNRAIFWHSVLHMALYKTLFLDFWFRPPNAQNLLPKICIKLPISRVVWQIDWRCLGLPGGFRGVPIQWNHAKCCGAHPCCHGNEIWARRGDPVAYRLVVGANLVCIYCRFHSRRWRTVLEAVLEACKPTSDDAVHTMQYHYHLFYFWWYSTYIPVLETFFQQQKQMHARFIQRFFEWYNVYMLTCLTGLLLFLVWCRFFMLRTATLFLAKRNSCTVKFYVRSASLPFGTAFFFCVCMHIPTFLLPKVAVGLA